MSQRAATFVARMERSEIRVNIKTWFGIGAISFRAAGTFSRLPWKIGNRRRWSSTSQYYENPFRVARVERPFQIDAIVVLPDHLHAIFTLPSDDSDFSARWKRIKSHFTRQLNSRGVSIARHSNGEYALWQRRFWEHTIRDDCDFERHLDYIHFNPVKHRLVTKVADWPYSSFHAFARRGLMPADWAGTTTESKFDFGERRD